MVERHGNEPVVIGFENANEEITEIRKIIAGFRQTDHHALGIICKTQKQADELYEQLKDESNYFY